MTKTRKRILNMVFIALGAVLIAVGAWITVPFAVIPFTMQTFAVFAVTMLLGGRRASASVLVYIALGAVGVPVFSSFRGGIGVLAGATGGYIVGFVTIPLVYWLFLKLFGDKFFIKLAALVVGMALCYLFGTVWYVIVFSGDAAKAGFIYAMSVCVAPYLPFDVAKLALAFALCAKAGKYIDAKL